jgi:hypothetical protein
MNNKAVWVVIGTLFALVPLGALVIPIAEGESGLVAIQEGRWRGLFNLTWIPTALSCLAFYLAFQSANPED